MQFLLPAALALALPAGIVLHDLAPLRDVALGTALVALLSLAIARAAEAEEERRVERRLFSLTHRLWRSWIRRPR
jgi:hypothetical protein